MTPKENNIAEWTKKYGKPVSEEEYRQIAGNLDGFFSILKEWDDKENSSNEVNVEIKNVQANNHRS